MKIFSRKSRQNDLDAVSEISVQPLGDNIGPTGGAFEIVGDVPDLENPNPKGEVRATNSSTDNDEDDAQVRDAKRLLRKNNSTTASSGSDSFAHLSKRQWSFTFLIVLVGAGASAAFLSMGLHGAQTEQDKQFDLMAREFTKAIEDAWDDYELFGLWIHESCRSNPNRTYTESRPASERLGICSRQEFRELYEYIKSVGLEFQSAQFMPNVTHASRAALEEEARDFYNKSYPHVNYRGIIGLFPKEGGGMNIQEQTEQPFYWPVHYVEPVEGNEKAIELDLWSSPTQHKTIENTVKLWTPAMTDRLQLVQETDPSAYSIILHHPGIPLSTREGQDKPDGFSLMVIRIPDLIKRAARASQRAKAVYVYDSTHTDQDPVFLGATLISRDHRGGFVLSGLPEVELHNLTATDTQAVDRRMKQTEINVADRQWIVVIHSLEGTFQPEIVFIVLGGCLIFFASVILAIWFYTHMNRIFKMNELKSKAETEKAAIIVDTARRQTLAERQLNEYIAHEVRNPLSSAIAALSFVSATAQESLPGVDDTKHQRMLADIGIIDSSLQFINELLRNMLDMHRAANRQMKITMAPTDVLRDVLEPVKAILHMRGNKVDVISECPKNFVVISDRLRLKQIVLNLAINATKFVEQGYIRLSASVNDAGTVQLCIEDSGPGIPQEKRGKLFAKFQESLDLLNQGTGIGLCLCKHLAQLMDGDIWLDENFESGVDGCPGSRFVLDLNVPPMRYDDSHVDEMYKSTSLRERMAKSEDGRSNQEPHIGDDNVSASNGEGSSPPPPVELPDKLKVLFVDDDLVLRKLFIRSLQRVAGNWDVQEACNGETALHVTQEHDYDLIMMDQYMSSIDKQLLGTETVRKLRSNGVKSRICGLSANDCEESFLDAGADCFMIKPFPCEPLALERALLRVLFHGRR